jgi:hypothetical protein
MVTDVRTARGAHIVGAGVVATLLVACGSDTASSASSDELRAQVGARSGAGAGLSVPAPVGLPEGWAYVSAGGSSDGGAGRSSTVTLDFVKLRAGGAPLPAVTMCVVASEGAARCQTAGSVERSDIAYGVSDQGATLIGSAAALADWRGVTWTTDLDAVRW